MNIDTEALELVMQTGGELYNKCVFTKEQSVRILMPIPDISESRIDVDLDMLKFRLENAVLNMTTKYDEIGVLLSGGVDSSLLLHLVKEMFPDVRVIAYHTDFGVPERSELEDAILMARHENINLKIVDVSPEKQVSRIDEALFMIKTLSYSAIPVYMAFEQMRLDGIHYALNALGLDELMAGYTIHKRYFDRQKRLLKFIPFMRRSPRLKYVLRLYGNDKAFLLSNIISRPDMNFVEGSELSIADLYNKMEAGNLWDTIQQWTYAAMEGNFATLIRRGAWTNGIRVSFPYMDYPLMKYCHSIKPVAKKNKAPIRQLMREVYKIPEQIVCKGENWDKIGWGGTPLPYFDCASYMEQAMTNYEAAGDWFTDKAMHEIFPDISAMTLNAALFTKMLEVLDIG